MSFGARRASAADARGIAETRIESWRATYAGLMPQEVLDALDVETNAAFWERAVESEESATFVADRDGEVVRSRAPARLGTCATPVRSTPSTRGPRSGARAADAR